MVQELFKLDGGGGSGKAEKQPAKAKGISAGTVAMAIEDWHTAPLPGLPGAERGTGFIRASDLPDLTSYTEVNPRAPKPGGAVPKAIAKTLTTAPLQMALKNAGIYLLVSSMNKEGKTLVVDLKDPNRHGIVNGGHTYATIWDIKQNGTPEEKAQLTKAHVPIHVYSGIPDPLIVEMASGLNFTRQVQEASLENLRGHYDQIKKVLDAVPGGEEVAYFEGDKGSIPIGEVLAYMEMFNLERYPLTDNPYGLYAHRGRVIQEASEDFSLRRDSVAMVVARLPDILKLVDMIRRDIQELRGEAEPERRGRGRPRKDKSTEPKEKPARVLLPFLQEKVKDRLPNGWLYPILAAFRVNVRWNLEEKTFTWKRSNATILKAAAEELVSICQQEQRAAAGKPEWVGKRESAYRQCKMQVDLTLQKLTEK